MSKSAESDFWYEFDYYYNPEARTEEEQNEPEFRTRFSQELISMGYSDARLLGIVSSQDLNEYRKTEAGRKLFDAVKTLMPDYLDIIHRHFGPDFNDKEKIMFSSEWETFRDFGLGVLYDLRSIPTPRPPHRRVHVMDGAVYPQFARWHRFNWIASIVKVESPFAHRVGTFLYIDRLVGIAAEIHQTSKPRQSKIDGERPDNPPNGGNITEGQIENITNIWSTLDFDEIETRMAELYKLGNFNGPE